jgi:hypothetical protein
MLCLLFVFEGIVRQHEEGTFRTLTEASWCFSGRVARTEATGASLLAFGDSLAKNGISPPALQAVTDRSAYNLAAFGGPPALSYFLLRRVLESGGRPETLVLIFMPANLAAAPQGYLQTWQDMAGPREWLDLALATRDAKFLAQMITGGLFPSVRNRLELRDWIRDSLLGKPYAPAQRGATLAEQRGWSENHGVNLLPNPRLRRIEADLANAYLFPYRWRCESAESAYLRRFLDLARTEKIHVVCLLPPIASRSQEVREKIGLDEFFTKIVRNLQAHYPEITVVDGRRSGYPDTFFVDVIHLNGEGATRLSQDLGGVLRTLPSSDRREPGWSFLPPYHEEVAERRPEDRGRTGDRTPVQALRRD